MACLLLCFGRNRIHINSKCNYSNANLLALQQQISERINNQKTITRKETIKGNVSIGITMRISKQTRYVTLICN
jgi:hypothetical protein